MCFNLDCIGVYARDSKAFKLGKISEESQDNKKVVAEWKKIVDNSLKQLKMIYVNSMLMEIQRVSHFKVYFNDFMKKPQDKPIDDAIVVLLNWFANNLDTAWKTLIQRDFQLLLEWK